MGARSSSYSKSACFCLRFLFGVVAVVGFSWFLLFGFLENGGEKTMTRVATWSEDGNHQHMDVLGRDKVVDPDQLDLYYMSKRKVPNGPDPIHNRRAGKSRQPPGQA